MGLFFRNGGSSCIRSYKITFYSVLRVATDLNHYFKEKEKNLKFSNLFPDRSKRPRSTTAATDKQSRPVKGRFNWFLKSRGIWRCWDGKTTNDRTKRYRSRAFFALVDCEKSLLNLSLLYRSIWLAQNEQQPWWCSNFVRYFICVGLVINFCVEWQWFWKLWAKP